MLEYINRDYKPSRNDLVAVYYLEPNRVSIEEAAENIAAESSIGTWTDVSTLSKDIARRLKPNVFDIDRKNSIIKIAYAKELFEDANIPQVMSSIAGNIFGMGIVNNLRLLDIDFPKAMIEKMPGPKYGIDGIRRITKVKKRPLVGTIIKPKVGLNAKEHARVAYQAWLNGLDIVKDDENLTNQNFNKFKERISETLKYRDLAEYKTGEKKMYMPNITAETFEMMRRMEYVRENNGEYIMVDVITVGFSALQSLRKYSKEVIHGHRAMHAAITRNKKHGISMLALSKLYRLIGIDQLHIGAIVGKMEGDSNEVIKIGDEIEHNLIKEDRKEHVLEQKWYNIKPMLAVCSGGLHPGKIPRLMNYMGNNIVMQFGGGCHGHPDGTEAGARAIRQSVDATMKRITLKDYAKTHIELDKALNKWGM
jgi:ribulose-bisphosphate carboxylase large chain